MNFRCCYFTWLHLGRDEKCASNVSFQRSHKRRQWSGWSRLVSNFYLPSSLALQTHKWSEAFAIDLYWVWMCFCYGSSFGCSGLHSTYLSSSEWIFKFNIITHSTFLLCHSYHVSTNYAFCKINKLFTTCISLDWHRVLQILWIFLYFCGYLPRRGVASNAIVCVSKSVCNPFCVISLSVTLLDSRSCRPNPPVRVRP